MKKLMRCKQCDKPLKSNNKSGYCSNCGSRIRAKLKYLKQRDLKKEEKKKHICEHICSKCKVRTKYAYGIGDYCPKCGRDYGLIKIPIWKMRSFGRKT